MVRREAAQAVTRPRHLDLDRTEGETMKNRPRTTCPLCKDPIGSNPETCTSCAEFERLVQRATKLITGKKLGKGGLPIDDDEDDGKKKKKKR